MNAHHSRLADNETGYDILKCMKRADDILEPTRPSSYYGIVPRSLNETRPKLLGTWVFRDPSRANDTIQLFMVVQIDWTEDEHGMYEKGQARFYKLESGQMGMKGNMDINLLELGE